MNGRKYHVCKLSRVSEESSHGSLGNLTSKVPEIFPEEEESMLVCRLMLIKVLPFGVEEGGSFPPGWGGKRSSPNWSQIWFHWKRVLIWGLSHGAFVSCEFQLRSGAGERLMCGLCWGKGAGLYWEIRRGQWLSGCLDRPDKDIKCKQRAALCRGQGLGQTGLLSIFMGTGGRGLCPRWWGD